MREYHIDLHTHLYLLVQNERMGGDLSVCKLIERRPSIIIGQDESVFKQYSFSSKSWQGVSGERTLLPKSDGYSLMVSAFCSRVFGLGLHVNSQQLEEINKRRSEGDTAHYLNKESANEIYGTTLKKIFNDKHLLIRYFEVGIMREGYWNFHHMALQIEDMFDVLAVIYPHCDYVLLMDQSSGHGRSVKDALDASSMNVKYGGDSNMRKTRVTNVGNYFYNDIENPQLQINDEQEMKFTGNHKGPFYLKTEEQELSKLPQPSGKRKERNLTIADILVTLKRNITFYHNEGTKKEELHSIATELGVALETKTDNHVIPGWYNSQKGLLQVLYERGFIDLSKLSEYSRSGKKKEMDKDGKVMCDYKQYVLTDLMENCDDFKNQKNAIEELCEQLSLIGDPSIRILTSPKYHCEIAGEGIELNWGYCKKCYRNIPFDKKNKKDKFVKHVKESIQKVTLELVQKFAAKTHRYMKMLNKKRCLTNL